MPEIPAQTAYDPQSGETIPIADVSDMSSEWEQIIRASDGRDPEQWHDVRITAPGPTGVMARIELDGVPMKGVRSYSVRVGVHEANEVTVTFIAGSVNRETADGSPAHPDR